MRRSTKRILYLVTEDWYFLSHRLVLAKAMRAVGWDVVVATRVTAEGERIAAEGLRVAPIRLRRNGRSPSGELLSLAELVRLYRAERPDVVHHVALKPVLYGSVAARVAGIPATVNALAGLGYIFGSEERAAVLARPAARRLLRWTLSRPRSRAIVQNPDDRDLLLRIGVPAERIVLVRGSGVDTTRFAPSSQGSGEVIVAMVSRMLRDKGVGELVEAARLLRGRGVRVRVVLAGMPDPQNPTSIREHQLEDWTREGVVEWRGAVADIPALWAKSHIAVLPSYREGLPKSLLEAGACGRPMISTDVPGCREIVRHQETGLLIPARDSRALAAAIEHLAADADLREQFGQRARILVQREFSQERVMAETLALYEEVLREAGQFRVAAR